MPGIGIPGGGMIIPEEIGMNRYWLLSDTPLSKLSFLVHSLNPF
jgi:hypothetical protein